MSAERLYRYVFIVEGDGRFPIDMLRYDRAYPASETDSFHITCEGHRKVTLVSVGMSTASRPTYARWKSFGWSVLK